jgi:ATP-dependent DNA ligase
LDHTYVAALEKVKTPKSLRGARVRGEIYAVDEKGKAIPNRELAGILNASPQKGRDKLQEKNLKLRLGVFDVISGPGGKDMRTSPWAEKHKVLKKVERAMKGRGFHVPDTAFTAGQQRALFKRILSGKHPETKEGVVVWPTHQADRPTKIKFRPHHQVYVHTVHEGRGHTNQGTMGRYSYSLTPNGPPVGFVGTGFNREQADWMWKNRRKIKGRKVVIQSLGQFPSGAFRAPSHSHLHL